MSKGVLRLQEILELQKKIVPELIDVLDKRYIILRTIYYKQPIGRRALALDLSLSERIVRNEINFLKSRGLIDIHTSGMSVTALGEILVNKLKKYIYELRGLSEIEDKVKELLNVKKVIIVPGNADENPTVLKELGKACSNCLKDIIKDNDIIAITGGTTIKEVVEAFQKTSDYHNILVVPARGGMGGKVETQANMLVAIFADKIKGDYKMLHIPENISNDVLDDLLKERNIKEVIDCVHKADILLYGIGRAIDMAKKRGASEEELEELASLGAVGESIGSYFDSNSNIVYKSASIGISIEEARKVKINIAVAACKLKASSVISTQLNNKNGILVTDEALGKEIIKILENTND